MRWQPYPKYKDSGIEWIGKIPEWWKLKRLKYCAQIIMGQSPNSEDCNQDSRGIPFLQGNAEFGKSYPKPKHFCENPKKITQKEDILLSVRAPVGELNIADQNYCIGRGLCGIRSNPNRLKNNFLWFLLFQTRNELNFHTTGSTYDAVSSFLVNNMISLLPSIEEQSQIAAFLDHETSRIDKLVEKKQRQIELLQEKRSALITHAMTKGLNPDDKMKDSGIEWIGEIPEGWEVKKLKFVANVRLSNVDKKSVEGEDEVLLCNYLDVYKNEYISNKIGFMKATASQKQIENFSLEKEDVLITKDSEAWDDIAVPAIVKEKLNNVICGYHLAHIKPIKNIILGRYIFRSIMTSGLKEQFWIEATGVTRFGISKYNIENSLFLIPTLKEQIQIADYLDKETTKIDRLIIKINTSIEKLREFRSALITAAVTGKIDVRNWDKGETS